MRNMVEKEIYIGTSLAPKNIETQRYAIQSWLRSGFKVVTFNTEEEHTIIKEFFEDLDVIFEVITDTERQENKELPRMRTILNGLEKYGDAICGYSNSDIILEHVDASMKNFIFNEAKDGLLIVQRNEIDNIEDIRELNFIIHFDGIDTFFISKEYVDIFNEYEVCVQNVWDIILLKIASQKGIKVKKLANPISFHIRHSQKWNFLAMQASLKKALGSKAENENAVHFFIKAFYEYTYNSVEMIAISHCNSKKITLNKKYIWEDCSQDVISWIQDKYKTKDFSICPFLVRTSESGNQLVEACRYLSTMLDIVKESGDIIVYGQENSRILFIPIAYKIVQDEELIEQVVGNEYYIAPAGIRANEWRTYHSQELKDKKFLGYIDSYKIGEDIKRPDEIVDKHVTVFLASKYYHREIKKNLEMIIDEECIIDAGKIVEVTQNGKIRRFK